ncbi:cupin domain-containing protein [Spirosoma koreense]
MNDYAGTPVSAQTAEHYTWGTTCDGWHLVKSDSLSIIQERMPPGTLEVKHYHQQARQFFFVLAGEATLAIGNQIVVLKTHEGMEIEPMVPHQMRNDSSQDLHFLVTSAPKSHGDRIIVP